MTAVICCLLILSTGAGYLRFLLLEKFSIQQHFVDGSTYVSHIATRYSKKNKLTILLLGGSVTREGTLSDNAMENLWRERYGEEIDFINLGSSSQSIFESLALLSTMKLSSNSIVIQQFSFKNMGSSVKLLRNEYLSPRMTYLDYSLLGALVPFFDRVQRMLLPELLLYAGPIRLYLNDRKCSIKTLLSGSGRSTCFRNRIVKRSYYAGKSPKSLSEKRVYVRNMQRQIIMDYSISLSVMLKMSRMVKEWGARMLFCIYPFDNVENEINAKITSMKNYKEMIEILRSNNRILSYQGSSQFSHNDFYDSQHMTLSGKEKFSLILFEDLHKIASGGN